jgi:hypothetical protein
MTMMMGFLLRVFQLQNIAFIIKKSVFTFKGPFKQQALSSNRLGVAEGRYRLTSFYSCRFYVWSLSPEFLKQSRKFGSATLAVKFRC